VSIYRGPSGRAISSAANSTEIDPPVATALEPEARALLDRLALPPGTPGLATLNPAAARRAYRDARLPLVGPAVDVSQVIDIPAAGEVPALRIYRPLAPAGHPLSMIFLHGGGWTLGDLETYDSLCRRLANRFGADLIWVSYRLAPEHPYPVPLEDSLAACRWVMAHAEDLQIDRHRIVIAGDSAGANLAAVAALSNRQGELGARFLAQLLIYPCLDLTAQLPSHRQLATGYLLTKEIYDWYLANYIAEADPADWRLSPLFARDLTGLCPTISLYAGFDPLRDEAIAFHGRLREAGLVARQIAFPGMIHGFINMAGVLPQAQAAVEQLHSSLIEALRPADL